MTIETIDRAQWHPFFESLTRAIRGRGSDVEVASAELGDQMLAQGKTLLGISYDERSGVLEIALNGLDHRIAAPASLHVDREGGAVRGIEVLGSDAARTLIRLRDTLLLPPPGGEGADSGDGERGE